MESRKSTPISPPTDNHLGLLIRLLVFLNIFDTVLTLTVVGLKWATEANPIMNYLLQAGPMLFGFGKLILVGGSTLLLWKSRQSLWAVPGAQICVLAYSSVVAYELAMILAIVFGS